jgi:hypothetical protein
VSTFCDVAERVALAISQLTHHARARVRQYYRYAPLRRMAPPTLAEVINRGAVTRVGVQPQSEVFRRKRHRDADGKSHHPLRLERENTEAMGESPAAARLSRGPSRRPVDSPLPDWQGSKRRC